jgi:hypothetical protein
LRQRRVVAGCHVILGHTRPLTSLASSASTAFTDDDYPGPGPALLRAPAAAPRGGWMSCHSGPYSASSACSAACSRPLAAYGIGWDREQTSGGGCGDWRPLTSSARYDGSMPSTSTGHCPVLVLGAQTQGDALCLCLEQCCVLLPGLNRAAPYTSNQRTQRNTRKLTESSKAGSDSMRKACKASMQ